MSATYDEETFLEVYVEEPAFAVLFPTFPSVENRDSPVRKPLL